MKRRITGTGYGSVYDYGIGTGYESAIIKELEPDMYAYDYGTGARSVYR